MTAIIELGANIIGRDGEKLGVVDSLVVEPESGKLNSIVVRKGLFFPTDKILPISLVTDVSGNRVMINATKEDLEQLAEYMDAEYMLPPAGYYGAGGYLWPSTAVFNAGIMVDEQIRERMPDAIILSEGTLVVDQRGETVGRVIEVASDDQGRVVGFKVDEGFFRHHEHYIPAHLVNRADDNVVRLSIDKQSLENITDPEDERRVRPGRTGVEEI